MNENKQHLEKKETKTVEIQTDLEYNFDISSSSESMNEDSFASERSSSLDTSKELAYQQRMAE